MEPPRPGAAWFHRLECSLAKAREFAGFVPNPQGSVRPLVKAGDQAIAQARHLTGIEDSNFHTIEADQAVISAQPEITILGLDYRSYRVLLQSSPEWSNVQRDSQTTPPRARAAFASAKVNPTSPTSNSIHPGATRSESTFNTTAVSLLGPRMTSTLPNGSPLRPIQRPMKERGKSVLVVGCWLLLVVRCWLFVHGLTFASGLLGHNQWHGPNCQMSSAELCVVFNPAQGRGRGRRDFAVTSTSSARVAR